MLRAVIILFLSVLVPRSGPAQDAAPTAAFDSFREERGTSSFTLLTGGSLRADYYRSSRMADDETDFYGATAQVKLIPVFNDTVDGKAEARFLNPDVHGGRTPSAVSLPESYVTVHTSRADLRVGKQNVVWGRADAANPTDNLTPRDYTILLPFDEDQRFGTTAIKLDVRATSEFTVTLFTTPLFKPSKIPLSLPSGDAVRKNEPAHTFSNSEVGVKADKTGGETDWSVSYYHGFSLMPEIRYAGLTPSGHLFEMRYPGMDVFGADVARNYGRYGFRAEAAYFEIRDYSTQEATRVRPYLSYVLGIDRTFLQNLNINMQLLGNRVANYKDPASIQDPIYRSIATKNAVLFNQLHRTNYGFTLRIVDRWFNETLEAEMLLMAYFNPSNRYLRPLVSYAFTDRTKGSIGAEIYSGARDSYFGSIKSNQGGFAEIRYSF